MRARNKQPGRANALKALPTKSDAKRAFGAYHPKDKGLAFAGHVDSVILLPRALAAVEAQVASVYGVHPKLIRSRDRSAMVAEARQVLMSLLVERGASFTGIGRALKRDHATVIYARKKIGQMVEVCRHTRDRWDKLKHLGTLSTVLNPVIKYKTMLNINVDILAAEELSVEELEVRAMAEVFQGNAVPKLVAHTTEAL